MNWKATPTPMDTGDAMNTMVPLAFMLGTQEAYDFYKDLYNELKRKNERKEGVAADEKYRLLLGCRCSSWFALADFQYFNSRGAVFPAGENVSRGRVDLQARTSQNEGSLEHIALEVDPILDPLV
jgi:hypothetical protein